MLQFIIKWWKPLAVVSILLINTLIAYTAGENSVQKQWDKDRLAHATETAKYHAAIIDLERKSQANLLQKEKELTNEIQYRESVVVDLKSELNGLRTIITANKHKAPITTGTGSRSDDRTTASWFVLDECVTEYTELAETADTQRDKLAKWKIYGEHIIEFRNDVEKLNNVKSNLF